MSRPGTFRKGRDERRGQGTSRSGRKTKYYRKLCERIVTSPQALRAITKIVRDTRNPSACIQAQRLLMSYAWGLPRQSLELSSRPISMEQLLARSWEKN